MSDFLTNFNKNNYTKTLTDKHKKKQKKGDQKEELSEKTSDSRSQKRSGKKSVMRRSDKPNHEDSAENDFQADLLEEKIKDSERGADVKTVPDSQIETEDVTETELSSGREEETELDPTYQKRRKLKIILLTLGCCVALVLSFVGYYFFSHVKMPDFIGKDISVARKWAVDNNVEIDVEQVYDFDKEVNTIIKQAKKSGKQVKKKSTVKLIGSLGPDPEELVKLPDFSTMSKTSAEKWVIEKKAENVTILEEYNDKLDKGAFVRQEIKNKDLTGDTYRRKDQAVVYFSKGKETLEKNVTVPEFKGKLKAEVESWVKTNEIQMTYKTVSSDTVDDGMIISQSIAKDQKIAKRDSMEVEVSTGKAIDIPNFAEYNSETAANVEGLQVTVKQVFSGEVPFGQLIAQSIPAGERVSVKVPKPITVTYSVGRPYLRSYYGQLEGDLDKLFFEEYQSKGANIRYSTYYVDSSEERGKIVAMSTYNQYVSMDYVVSIGVSNGSSEPPQSSSTQE